jgi:hypothetical protein
MLRGYLSKEWTNAYRRLFSGNDEKVMPPFDGALHYTALRYGTVLLW